eukprot:5037340-Amphidinium_carterae.1
MSLGCGRAYHVDSGECSKLICKSVVISDLLGMACPSVQRTAMLDSPRSLPRLQWSQSDPGSRVPKPRPSKAAGQTRMLEPHESKARS